MKSINGLGLALAGVMALGACGSDGPDSTISGVVPGDVFAGRTANVLISGSATDWSEGVAVSFGDGITVGEVTIASPTALYVPITIAGDAALGSRDVSVDDLDYAAAFNVVSALNVLSTQGTVAQGSLATITLQSLDFTTPFDTSGNIEIVLREGVTAVPQSISAEPYTLSFTLATDVLAAAGAVDLEVLSGPADGEPLSFKLPAALDVAARTAEAATGDIAGSFAGGGDSQLFSFDPGALAIVNGLALPGSPDGSLVFYVLGAGGTFAADILAVGQPGFFDPTAAASFLVNGPVFVIASDASGLGGDFSIAMTVATVGDAAATEDAGDNDSDSNAQTIAAPITVASGLSDDTDEDWYEFVVSAENAGKIVGVATFEGNMTDTVIDVFESDGTTSVLPDGEVDASFHETTFTPPLDAGTYFIRILNTYAFIDSGFLPNPGPYNLAVGFGAAPE